MKSHIKSLDFLDPSREETLAHLQSEIGNYLIPKAGLDVCVDIGANVGAFTSIQQPKFDRIYCFEPGYNTYLWLLETIEEFDNVKAFNMAVGRHTGISKLKTFMEGHTECSYNASTLEHPIYWQDEYEPCMTVDFKTMLELIDEPCIDYMKIDCEGSEYDFLIGQDLGCINAISMEFHHHMGKACVEALLNWLRTQFPIHHEYGIKELMMGTGHTMVSYER